MSSDVQVDGPPFCSYHQSPVTQDTLLRYCDWYGRQQMDGNTPINCVGWEFARGAARLAHEIASDPTVEMVAAASGGRKQAKERAYMDMPVEALRALAAHYHWAKVNKYPNDEVTHQPNYKKGYPLSLSYEAAMDHLLHFADGETYDPETGSNHVIAVAWHALNMFMLTETEWDDRWMKD